MDSDLKDLDLYEILGIQQSATVNEIQTAYRKKALQCHPDKNPDNPEAVQMFLQLSKISALLTDEAARLDYDKLVNSKTAPKSCSSKKEPKRLRMESGLGQRQIEKKQTRSYFILKIKWMKAKEVYDRNILTSLFSKYGDVITVVILQNKRSIMAFVVYESKTSAINAKNKEVGFGSCPLTVSYFGDFEDTSDPNPSIIYSAH